MIDRYVPDIPAPVLDAPGATAERRAATVFRYPALVGITSATLIGLIASYSMHLVNLRMKAGGFTGTEISLSVALQALGICISVMLGRHIVARIGLKRTIPVAAALCAVSLAALSLNLDLSSIYVVRVAFALGLGFLLIASEYFVTCGERATRAGRVASYTTALAAGSVAGPFLAGLGGMTVSSFLVGSAIILVSAALLSASLLAAEGVQTRSPASSRSIAFAPAVVLAGLLFGIADNAGLSLLPIYGAMHQWDLATATNLGVFAGLGAMVSQYPLARLAVRYNASAVLLVLCVCGAGLLIALPFVIGDSLLSYIIAAGLGGVVEGLYTAALVIISADRRSQNLTALNALFLAVCSAGEILGPAAVGISMDVFGTNGMILALVAAFAACSAALMTAPLVTRVRADLGAAIR
jgi:predicted MFS family arabinose efflux permease